MNTLQLFFLRKNLLPPELSDVKKNGMPLASQLQRHLIDMSEHFGTVVCRWVRKKSL